MADTNPENEPTIVERWLEDQQQWQRTVLAYLDSMTKNDDFLVTSATPCGARCWPASPTRPRRLRPRLARRRCRRRCRRRQPDERLDKVLFALHQLARAAGGRPDDPRRDPRRSLAKRRRARPRKTAPIAAPRSHGPQAHAPHESPRPRAHQSASGRPRKPGNVRVARDLPAARSGSWRRCWRSPGAAAPSWIACARC